MSNIDEAQSSLGGPARPISGFEIVGLPIPARSLFLIVQPTRFCPSQNFVNAAHPVGAHCAFGRPLGVWALNGPLNFYANIVNYCFLISDGFKHVWNWIVIEKILYVCMENEMKPHQWPNFGKTVGFILSNVNQFWLSGTRAQTHFFDCSPCPPNKLQQENGRPGYAYGLFRSVSARPCPMGIGRARAGHVKWASPMIEI